VDRANRTARMEDRALRLTHSHALDVRDAASGRDEVAGDAERGERAGAVVALNGDTGDRANRRLPATTIFPSGWSASSYAHMCAREVVGVVPLVPNVGSGEPCSVYRETTTTGPSPLPVSHAHPPTTILPSG
jgi:hypothetical protein